MQSPFLLSCWPLQELLRGKKSRENYWQSENTIDYNYHKHVLMFYLDKSRMILHSLIIITHRQRDLLADYFFARKGFAPEDAHKCSSYRVIVLLGSTSGRYPADRVYIEWIANWCRHWNELLTHMSTWVRHASECAKIRTQKNISKKWYFLFANWATIF